MFINVGTRADKFQAKPYGEGKIINEISLDVDGIFGSKMEYTYKFKSE